MIAQRVTAINSYTKIRRERMLPQAGEVVVSVGRQVSPVQVVARTSRQKGYTLVPAAQILGVAPSDVPQYLLAEEGTAIQKKKPLLRKSALFGSKQYTSPVNGILYQVSNGRLILQQTPDLLELRAMIQGTVSRVSNNRGVIIETQGALIQAAWGSGREGYGTIKVVAETAETPLTTKHIDGEVRGAILVAGYLQQAQVLEAAEENSVRGIVVGSVPASFVPALSDYRFPILVTDGFRAQKMAAPFFRLLQQVEGHEASLLGAPKGARERAEIIIPLPSAEREAMEAEGKVSGDEAALEKGRRILLRNAPYAGQVGEVVALHERARATAVGHRLPGASVALENGKVVFVPTVNLDMIR